MGLVGKNAGVLALILFNCPVALADSLPGEDQLSAAFRKAYSQLIRGGTVRDAQKIVNPAWQAQSEVAAREARQNSATGRNGRPDPVPAENEQPIIDPRTVPREMEFTGPRSKH